MDHRRFDHFSRSLARGLSRRTLIGGLSAGGLLAGAGARPVAAQGEDEPRICRYRFEAGLSVGPSLSDAELRSLEGFLEIEIGADGAIDRGALTFPDREPATVVGQATGRAINLRVRLDKERVLTAVGTGSAAIERCRGELVGLLRGPNRGDLGDWTATILPPATPTPTSTAAGSAAGSATASTSTGQPTATSTPCEITCDATTTGLLPDRCECGCADPILTACEDPALPGYFGCRDLMGDIGACGACGNACYFNPQTVTNVMCVDGVCRQDCVPGLGSCDTIFDPCSIDLMTDPRFCGSCAFSCPENFICVNGNCLCGFNAACSPGGGTANADCTGCVCPDGLTVCGYQCVNLALDPANCGACGASCGENEDCLGGGCITTVVIDEE
jgi:hypothetical protein